MPFFRALLSVTLVSSAWANSVLTNYPSWDGSTHTQIWGQSSSTTTFGETFRADVSQSADGMSAPILESVFFQLQDLTPGAGATVDFTFSAYLYEWNGTSIVGPSLANRTLSTFGGIGFQSIGSSFYLNLFTIGVPLTPGMEYIVFLTTIGAESFNTNNQAAVFGALPAGVVPDSDFFYNNGTTFSDLSAPWSSSSALPELAFALGFHPPPVPDSGGTIALVVIGAAAVALFRLFVPEPNRSAPDCVRRIGASRISEARATHRTR